VTTAEVPSAASEKLAPPPPPPPPQLASQTGAVNQRMRVAIVMSGLFRQKEQRHGDTAPRRRKEKPPEGGFIW